MHTRVTRWRGLVAGVTIVWIIGAIALGQTSIPAEQTPDFSVDSILTYLDSAAMWMGNGIVELINESLTTPLPFSLGRPLGYMIVLTAFFILAAASRRTRFLLFLGLLATWVLLIIRFVTAATG